MLVIIVSVCLLFSSVAICLRCRITCIQRCCRRRYQEQDPELRIVPERQFRTRIVIPGLMNSRDGQVIPQQDAQAVHQNLIREYEKHIPQVKFKKDDKVVDEFGISECVICLDKFKESEFLSKLSTCRHIFHPHCIIKWFSGE